MLTSSGDLLYVMVNGESDLDFKYNIDGRLSTIGNRSISYNIHGQLVRFDQIDVDYNLDELLRFVKKSSNSIAEAGCCVVL